MKKKIMSLLCLVILCLLMITRGNNHVNNSLDNNNESALSTKEQPMTKENVMNIFTSDEKYRNSKVTGCVVANDLAYGLTGVVQYTDIDGNSSCLAFVKDSWSHPIDLDAENLSFIADDSNLIYQGNGIVTLSLRNSINDVVYDYTVEYKCEDSNTDFIISSAERK